MKLFKFIKKYIKLIIYKFNFYLVKIFGNKKERYTQVVICGIPRSGTSLLFNMLSSSLVGFKVYYGKNSEKRSRETTALNVLMKKGNYITKKPDDIFNIEKIEHDNVRNKKVIIFLTVRDLRDVIISKHQWGDGNYYLSWDKKHGISGVDLYNRGLQNYILEIKKVLKKNYKNISVYLVKYETFASNLNIIIDILNTEKIQHKGIESLKNFKGVYPKGEKSNKKVKLQKEKWKNIIHKERIAEQFLNKQLRDELLFFEYEKNDKWYFENFSEN